MRSWRRLGVLFSLLILLSLTAVSFLNCSGQFQAQSDFAQLTSDLTAPTVKITSGPQAFTNQSSASFAFSGNGINSYECQLDDGSYAACSPPITFTGLSAISHTFRVRGIDSMGNVGTPAILTWVIDTQPPASPILTSSVTAQTTSKTVDFLFSSSDLQSGVASYRCSLDNAEFITCTSPRNLSALSEGPHSFKVRAVDKAGNVSDDAAFNWVVIPPTSTPPDNTLPADAIWVATTGNDTTGTGSSTHPYQTISKALSRLTSGGTVVVKSGLYTGAVNSINQKMHPFPDGSASKFTTIRAEVPLQVRIENTGSLNYYDNLLSITGQYIKVDGFVFVQKDSKYPPYVGQVTGSFVKIMRSHFKRQGVADEYGGFFSLMGHDNLAEDLAGVGHARYGFYSGGPDSNSQRNIYRRIVARVDYVTSPQPKAAFAIYGNNGSVTQVKDFLVQNLIVLDGKTGPTSGQPTYGGVYSPKTVNNIKYNGCIVLNNMAEYAGFYMAEYASTQSVHLINSVSWANYGSSGLAGVRANNGGGDTKWDQLTVGQNPYAFYANINGAGNLFLNSLLLNNSGLSTTGNGGFDQYVNVSTSINPSLKYIVDSETHSGGAKILFRYGKSGTLWGESGYDQVTTEKLWPYPYENEIKALFAEDNPPVTGAVPATNATRRGFAGDGNDAFGKPQTLTRYIWQYLGNRIPNHIYGE